MGDTALAERDAAMEKKTYYVTVGNGQILEDKANADYEFAIEATPEEVERLRLLFERTSSESFDTFLDAHIPFKMYNEDQENTEYDAKLFEIYRMIYELGTPETKQFIAENRILEKLKDIR